MRDELFGDCTPTAKKAYTLLVGINELEKDTLLFSFLTQTLLVAFRALPLIFARFFGLLWHVTISFRFAPQYTRENCPKTKAENVKWKQHFANTARCGEIKTRSNGPNICFNIRSKCWDRLNELSLTRAPVLRCMNARLMWICWTP